MKFAEEFRDTDLAQTLVRRIARVSRRPARLMEFCGGHTVSIFKYGIRQLLPPNVEMLSGPGCPVCVTPNTDVDKVLALARTPGVVTCAFGDMLKVPGSYGSLQSARAEGAVVRIVYSTLDALGVARANPDCSVVFLGIGFETTAPTVAASILQAERENLKNYYVLSMHKLCPPVIKALLDSGEVRLDGLICPGHVSAIIGTRPYEFAPRDYGIACVVSGFEPVDILLAVEMLLEQIEQGRPCVESAYPRGVTPEGNERALELMYQVFEPAPGDWRGMGAVAASGLRVRERYARFDAERAFPVDPPPPREHPGCRCGDVLRGVLSPPGCPLFARVCTPASPVGPCMVSSEGTCAAYFQYGGQVER